MRTKYLSSNKTELSQIYAIHFSLGNFIGAKFVYFVCRFSPSWSRWQVENIYYVNDGKIEGIFDKLQHKIHHKDTFISQHSPQQHSYILNQKLFL